MRHGQNSYWDYMRSLLNGYKAVYEEFCSSFKSASLRFHVNLEVCNSKVLLLEMCMLAPERALFASHGVLHGWLRATKCGWLQQTVARGPLGFYIQISYGPRFRIAINQL